MTFTPVEWPLVDGAGQVINKAATDNYDTQINAALEDTTSGGGAGSDQSPAETTAEVRDARDGYDDLNERLAALAGFARPEWASQLHNRNWIINDDLQIWADGDSAAPTGWSFVGLGAPTIARTGSGVGDGTVPRFGTWCAKVVADAAGPAYLRQNIIPAAVMAKILRMWDFGSSANPPGYVQLAMGGAGHAKCVDAGDVSIFLSATSRGEILAGSHAGGNQFDVVRSAIAAAMTFNFAATDDLYMGWKVAAGKTAYLCELSGLLTPSGVSPQGYLPGIAVRKRHVVHFAGNMSAGTRKWAWTPDRPGIITSVQAVCGTAPAAQAMIFDLNTWDGAALTSMYSTRPQIAAGATYGAAAAPDTTYARRCLQPGLAAIAAGSLVTLDCDQVGVGTVGADVTVTIGYLEYERPFNQFFNYDTV